MTTDDLAEPGATSGTFTSASAEEHQAESPFPIVGIGASAGGLEAFTQLLAHLPAHTGMAFVLVQHLDPRHESRLTDLLARGTPMPVVEATHGLVVEPDHVYVIPPNTSMAIAHGALQVTPRGKAPGLHLPVDHFLRALAQAQQAQAIGVVLSGTGSDGTLGIREIKAAGGITLAQEPGSARHDGMPSSAIGSGAVDVVLPPEGIARRLAEIGAHPDLAQGPVEAHSPESEDHFARVLRAVRVATGVDFTQYRDTTIRRRVARRMALHGESSLASYAGRLSQDVPEVEALYRDLLIHVTSFFRDPALFEALKTGVFPQILKAKPADARLRLWVPGCSTGQEAYSLAIALWEFFDDAPLRRPFQIFATDLIDLGTLERARAGVYPESIEAELTPERLRRFFTKEDHHYRIDKAIRDCCIFARQNLTADPPFSHLDLVSCRNVLIYMAPLLQRRILPTFHYALNVPGFLVLGSSETVGEVNGLFEATDRANKIYAKQVAASRPLIPFLVADYTPPGTPGPRAHAPGSTPEDFQKEADRLLSSRYAPPGVLVNEHLDILQFRGRTGPYLEAPPGEPTMSLLKMARPGLFVEIRSAVNEALARGEAVRREGLSLREEQGTREVAIEAVPVRPSGSAAQCCLVLFEDGGGPKPAPAFNRAPGAASGWLPRLFGRQTARAHSASEVPSPERDRETEQLRQELSSTREYLRSLVEQQDAANEELRSANEEILSANEELQSTNEELETGKEELQSTNEELTTVNEQLQHRNLELAQTTNDLQNLLSSTSIPVIMVGPDLRIRRLTPPARTIMNLLPTDVGRPIADFKANVDVPDLEALVAQVIADLQPLEREVRDREGRRYVLRIHPYRTADNKIDGAVLVLLDIEVLKRHEQEAIEARDYAEAVIATVREPLLVLDATLRVRTANAAFYRTFQVQPADVEGRLVFDLGDRQWNIPALRTLLEEVLPRENAFEDFEVQCSFPRVGHKTMLLNARGLYRAGHSSAILLAIEDITKRKQAEAALRISEERLSLAIHGTGMGTWDVDLPTGNAIWSDTYFRILGYEPLPGGETTLEMWRQRVHPDDREAVVQAIKDAKRLRTRYAMEYRILRAADGEARWLSALGSFVYTDSGEAHRFVGILLDVTERRRETAALSHQASHDPLTGLANRAELERRLGRVIGADPAGGPHAFLFLDLDQFKVVNDTCGHAAGDALLRQIPAVLERHLRKRDTLARLGGDEFGILLEHCSEARALAIAGQLVEEFQASPFAWEDKSFAVGVSIGLVAIPAGGETLSAVMTAADRACYAAKDGGRNRVHVYKASDEELRQRQGEMRWIPRLRRALEEERFRLYA